MTTLDRSTVEAVISFIEGGRLLHDGAPAATLARELVSAIRRDMLPPEMTPEEVYKFERREDSVYRVSQLRELLAGLPDDMGVLVQVVGNDRGAWNMWLGAHVLNGRVCFQAYHPDLLTLPPFKQPITTRYILRELPPGVDQHYWTIKSIGEGGVHLQMDNGGDTHLSLKSFMDLYTQE